MRIDPVRFLIREPNIGIEWRNSIRHSSEIRIGYIYPQPAMMWLYETFIPMTTGKYQGPSFAYQHRFWHSEKASYFLLSAQYRYLWHTNQWMYFGGSSGSGFDDVLLSQWRNDLIVKLAWSPNASYQKRIHFEAGLGVQLSQQYTRATDCTSCGNTTLSYEAQLEKSLELLWPNDGWFVRPWLHFSFSMPIVLSKKDKFVFRG
ncbi:MAG: hypothetical protein ACRC3B_22455 [Bacteroidia bacterium]